MNKEYIEGVIGKFEKKWNSRFYKANATHGDYKWIFPIPEEVENFSKDFLQHHLQQAYKQGVGDKEKDMIKKLEKYLNGFDGISIPSIIKALTLLPPSE